VVIVIPVLQACCVYLTSNLKVLICTTHIKKVIVKLYSFNLRSKITDKQYRLQRILDEC